MTRLSKIMGIIGQELGHLDELGNRRTERPLCGDRGARR
jgi:hypothetical protein